MSKVKNEDIAGVRGWKPKVCFISCERNKDVRLTDAFLLKQ